MALNDRMKPEERPSCVCFASFVAKSLAPVPSLFVLRGESPRTIIHPQASCLFFFGGGLLFLFLFLAVGQRTQLIECDLGGSSSSALSRLLARSPQSVGVIKGAHSSSKKKKKEVRLQGPISSPASPWSRTTSPTPSHGTLVCH